MSHAKRLKQGYCNARSPEKGRDHPMTVRHMARPILVEKSRRARGLKSNETLTWKTSAAPQAPIAPSTAAKIRSRQVLKIAPCRFISLPVCCNRRAANHVSTPFQGGLPNEGFCSSVC